MKAYVNVKTWGETYCVGLCFERFKVPQAKLVKLVSYVRHWDT